MTRRLQERHGLQTYIYSVWAGLRGWTGAQARKEPGCCYKGHKRVPGSVVMVAGKEEGRSPYTEATV